MMEFKSAALSKVLWVGMGGFLGSVARYSVSGWVHRIVRQARTQGLAGATVLRGLEGFGAHSRLHAAKVLRLSNELPIVIEIVDTKSKIEAFMPTIDGAIKEGLATLEKVEIRFYRSRSQS